MERLVDRVGLYEGHRAKARRPSLPSKKKLRFDTYSGIEPSHKYGKLVRVSRTFDKDNDWYSETVTDLQTGEILHECHEPLSKHIGHGTARPKPEA